MAIFLNFVAKTTLILLVLGGTVSFVFSTNQKPFVICTPVTSFALVLQVCTRVTEELHSFLSQSELSYFFVYIIKLLSKERLEILNKIIIF